MADKRPKHVATVGQHDIYLHGSNGDCRVYLSPRFHSPYLTQGQAPLRLLNATLALLAYGRRRRR